MSWAGRLGRAVEEYRREIDGGWERRLKVAGPSKGELKVKLHSAATIHYWTTVENNLPLLMNHIEAIGTDAAIPTREAWRKMLRSAAREAYRIACGQETPRQLRAFAKGWQKLTQIRVEPEASTHETKEEA
jgi:CRISPR system Cascade subunit CasA